jgi:hypothetical protein
MMKVERQLEDAIRTMLNQRADGDSITSSQAARQLGGPLWRSLEEPARRAAQRLALSGEVVISQKSGVVNAMGPSSKGPIRIQRPF